MPISRDSGEPLRYEVVKVQTCSGQPLEVTTSSGAYTYIQPATTAGDAFGRLRTSSPFTLFDSNHRYVDNNSWATSTGTGGTYTFSGAAGLVTLNVNTTSGAKVYRETKKVFPYQPGKSLQVMNTFTMASGQANLRQRVGYFSSGNGLFFEVSGTTSPYFVLRSSVSGSVVDTRVQQASWNVDPLDGTGPSKFTLDSTKAQISWFDIEWLGVGTVRAGFVINGQLVHCHSFHHANVVDGTYMTTATLPARYEIENLGTTATASTLKQICTTVLSEGGYDLRGQANTISPAVGSPYDLTTAGVRYPLAALRLKSSRLDAVTILAGISFLGITNNANYKWELVKDCTLSGGTWVDAGSNSSVEYNITATGISGGTQLTQGFSIGSNQGSTVVDITKDELLKYQLERNSFTGTPTVLALIASTQSAGADVLAALNWEEVVY